MSFSSPDPTILLAWGRNWELWEQPLWNNKGNNRILSIRFHAVFIYGACLKWLLPELSIPAAGQKDRRLWGREWSDVTLKTCAVDCVFLYPGIPVCLWMHVEISIDFEQ